MLCLVDTMKVEERSHSGSSLCLVGFFRKWTLLRSLSVILMDSEIRERPKILGQCCSLVILSLHVSADNGLDLNKVLSFL